MLRVFRLRDGRWLHASFRTDGPTFSTPLATNVQEIGESMGEPVEGFDVEDDADPRGEESTWVLQPPPRITGELHVTLPGIQVSGNLTVTPPSTRISTTEQQLRDAVDLIGGTTSNDSTVRAIKIVRDAIEFWRDSGDERAYFADVLGVGLDRLAQLIRDERPLDRQRTIFESLRRNAEDGLQWAHNNNLVQFIGYFNSIKEFIELIPH